jgi:hypothetical protein
VNAARVVVAITPGLAETLARDGRKAARFYARFRVTEAQLRHGVPPAPFDSVGDEPNGELVTTPRTATFKDEVSIHDEWLRRSRTTQSASI